jgi:hypothetical protein
MQPTSTQHHRADLPGFAEQVHAEVTQLRWAL